MMTDVLSEGRGRFESGAESEDVEAATIPREIELLKLRLAPLRHVEMTLISQLVQDGEDEPTKLGSHSFLARSGRSRSHSGADSRSTNEISVRPGSNWSNSLAAITNRSVKTNGTGSSHSSSSNLKARDFEVNAQDVLNSCRRDIITLWNDPLVRRILKKRKLRMEEQSGL